MSATNPSPGDRETEALRRAQRAHEPSMEEILASIRNMIGEERGAEKAAPSRSAPARSGAPAPQIVFSQDDPSPRVSQEAPQRVGPPSAPEAKLSPGEKLSPEAKPTPRTKPAPEAMGRAAAAPKTQALSPEPLAFALSEDEPLLSTEAGQSVTSAFEALSANLAAHGAEIAREMAREMLRPMLKAWLDENLPGIVERLVRAEIERVARGIR
jgi:cell pole-organizing protein PopZ